LNPKSSFIVLLQFGVVAELMVKGWQLEKVWIKEAK